MDFNRCRIRDPLWLLFLEIIFNWILPWKSNFTFHVNAFYRCDVQLCMSLRLRYASTELRLHVAVSQQQNLFSWYFTYWLQRMARWHSGVCVHYMFIVSFLPFNFDCKHYSKKYAFWRQWQNEKWRASIRMKDSSYT